MKLQMQMMVLGTAVALSPVVLVAQTDPTAGQQQPASTTGTPMAGQDSTGSSGATGFQMKDKMFIRKAAMGGNAEVKMGQLAADKGTSPEVKDFGSKMVTDHTMLNNEMKPIADSMGVKVPMGMNKMDQEEYDKLSGLSGDDFDKEYVTNMVKDHHKDLHEFHAEAMSTQDPTLKAAVEKGEKVIREHSRMIGKIAKDKGYMPAGGPAGGAGAPPPGQ